MLYLKDFLQYYLECMNEQNLAKEKMTSFITVHKYAPFSSLVHSL